MVKLMLNEFSQCVHNAQVERGFYEEKREIGTLLMLIVSELAEALEADRKGRYCPNGVAKEIYEESVRLRGCSSAFEGRVKDTFEDEIADTFIRLFDLVGYLGIDINSHIQAKLVYNTTRGRRHGKKY